MTYDDFSWIDIIQNTIKEWDKISQEMYGKDLDELSDNEKVWVWDEFIYQSHPQGTAEEVGNALNILANKLREAD